MYKILLVDDQVDIQRLTVKVLERQIGRGIEIKIASSGAEAEDFVLRDGGFDAVLLDLCLPEFIGFDVMDRLHEMRPHLPVIIMTGNGGEQTVIEALERGATSYISKQTLSTTLCPILMKVIETSRRGTRIRRVHDGLLSMRFAYEFDNDPELIAPMLDEICDVLARFNIGGESPRQILIGIEEAICNAMYHGNLEIGSELKHTNFSDFYKQAQAARYKPGIEERKIRLMLDVDQERATIVIEDDGDGFDPASIPDPTLPENIERAFGRGLLMMRAFFDEVTHNEKGNAVTLVAKAQTPCDSNSENEVTDAA